MALEIGISIYYFYFIFPSFNYNFIVILGVEFSYTIEASMAGSHDDLFHPSDYLRIGSEICSR